MLNLLLFAALATSKVSAVNLNDLDETQLLKIEFIERNVMSLLHTGHYPQVYNSTHEKIEACGCYYSPKKINWGTRIGLACARQWPTADFVAPYDKDECGEICIDGHGENLIMFCPEGWLNDCEKGCMPPDDFQNVEEMLDFMELTLTQLLMNGNDYIPVSQDLLDVCKCEDRVITPIRYGTQIGWECKVAKGETPDEEKCVVNTFCQNSEGRQLVTFCPSGFYNQCGGCEKALEESSNEARLEWMHTTITRYAQDSMELIGWEPAVNQIIDCACTGGLKQVNYGKALGFSCEVGDEKRIKQGCGAHVLCQDPDGSNLVHFCPQGFVPHCSEGCTFPWKKDEI